jgi:TfoX/Sxy family transcriptional regulator of competence genes
MTFSEPLAARVREVLDHPNGLTERKMFGGLAFLLNGNMCCGVVNDRLMLRLGESATAEALAEPHTRVMDFTGKPMKSMVYVDPSGYTSEEALRKWVGRAVAYASSLPAKA